MDRLAVLCCLLVGAEAAAEIPERFVRIEPGRFAMGSTDGDADERPVHTVTFRAPYEIMVHEVTVGQFSSFVEKSGYAVDGPCRYYTREGAIDDPYRHFSQPGFDQSAAHPVVCVSALDAQAYATWLSGETGTAHRLPSEAEWEYAARAGSPSAYAWPADETSCAVANISDLDRAVAHHDGRHFFGTPAMYDTIAEHTAMCPDGYVFTAPVMSYRANSFGLFDTTGNAWEWVADCVTGGSGATPPYAASAGDGSASVDTACNRHVIRGSSWHTGPRYSHITNRSSVPSRNRMYHLGFRLVREVRRPAAGR